MTAQFDLSPVTNPVALCLGIPILLLFAFLGYTAVAFGRQNIDIHRRDTRIARAIESSGVNALSQFDFRAYVMRLMNKQGYDVEVPEVVSGADDIGTDLIATKDGIRYSVFALRYAKVLSARPVTEANFNKNKYVCDGSMVVTNGTLRDDARKLAQSTGCIVIERAELAEWILAYMPQIEALL